MRNKPNHLRFVEEPTPYKSIYDELKKLKMITKGFIDLIEFKITEIAELEEKINQRGNK
ncbi:hypothetical protein [Rodentibacter rarus]|uniref:hypothetical protein n=1 Tax=Rodentibacter rarus TaxID=1908260 RepID=UPI00130133E0|nr:hypothetical protein [Rodentibacter rarus]